MPVYEAAVSDSDECECGNFRLVHKGNLGPCMLCPCLGFRLLITPAGRFRGFLNALRSRL